MQKIVHHENVSLFTEHFGRKSGVPLLFISGAMAPASFWPDFFCSSLAKKGFFVLRFDNRDFGKSTHFAPCRPNSGLSCPYTMDDLVSDCIRILGAHGIEKAHVIGHSLGGSIAQLLSVREPKTILSAVSISAPLLAIGCPGLEPPDPEIEQRTWNILLNNPMYPDTKRGIPEFLKVWKYLNGALPLDEQMAISYTKKIYETETIEPAWNHTAVQEGVPDLFSDMVKSRVPLLFVQGEEDYLVQNRNNIRIIAQQLEVVSCRLVKKAGHVFFNKNVWFEIEAIITEHLTENTQQ